MKINNQNIFGGNQQFADVIINSSEQFDETDRKLIELIHNNVDSKEGRKELIDSLEIVKSTDKPTEEKLKSGSTLRKFIDSVATEGGKQVIKELAENSSEYFQYIFK